MNFKIKTIFYCCSYVLITTVFIACNSGAPGNAETNSAAKDSAEENPPNMDSNGSFMSDSSMKMKNPYITHADSTEGNPPKQQKWQNAKGYAIVYCPTKMIIHVPSIIDAEITKTELKTAYSNFLKKIQKQNTNENADQLTKDIIGDSVNLFQKMRIDIQFDSDDFKEVSKDETPVKSFSDQNTLDWEWIVKPLQSTRKSIMKFDFYGIDPTNNEETNILEKTISVAVQVDARSFLEKWSDFLLDDPKTTITAIIIPVITFFGGFFSGKRNKK